MALSHLLILSVVVAAAVGKVVSFSSCSGVPQQHCSVSRVHITPCDTPARCTLLLGSDASLSFDFTPNFSTSNLKSMLYYSGSAISARGSGVSDDACPHTTCPSEAGVSQTFNFQFRMPPIIPKDIYPITLKLWNGDNEDQVCCFRTTIKVK